MRPALLSSTLAAKRQTTTAAQRKKAMLHNPKHLILEAPHPSPLSAFRGFFGSRPFSKTNAFLEAHGVEPIDWQIE